jgi:N-acetylmuramoyl-L-alanine amidase
MGRYRHPLLDAEAGVYRYDQLLVLRHTSMPAVLLEAGSIVNRQEELELATAERRTLTANAITDAAVDFCEMRSRLSGEPPPKRASSAKPIATGRGSPAGLAR